MKWLIPATAALALAATPALAAGQNDNDIINNAVKQSKSQAAPAQNSDRQDRNTEAQNERAQNDNERAQNDNDGSWSGHRHRHRNRQAMSLQKVRSALKNAGFTNIRVLDAKYLIQAKDNDGNTVFMAINPPSLNRPGAETSGAASNMESNGEAINDGQATNEASESRNDNGNYRRSQNFRGNNNGGYDQGYREGYNRGYENGSRY